jgi:hypothetical protein
MTDRQSLAAALPQDAYLRDPYHRPPAARRPWAWRHEALAGSARQRETRRIASRQVVRSLTQRQPSVNVRSLAALSIKLLFSVGAREVLDGETASEVPPVHDNNGGKAAESAFAV